MDKCLRSTDVINLVIAEQAPAAAVADIDEAKEHVARGASVWDWASNDDGEPDIVLAACGDDPDHRVARRRRRCCARQCPELRVRFVNVNDLYALASSRAPSRAGSPQSEFTQVFTKDRPVLFNFHGYPSAIHQLIHRRPQQARFHVRGYIEEGTTTTPFDLLAMNGVDRYQLAIEALTRADILAAEMLPGMSGEFAVRAVPDAEARSTSSAPSSSAARRRSARSATTRRSSRRGPGRRSNGRGSLPEQGVM